MLFSFTFSGPLVFVPVVALMLLCGAWRRSIHVQRGGRKHVADVAFAVACIGWVGVVAVTPLCTTCSPRMPRCGAYLRELNGAKEQWALEHHKTAKDVPKTSDLIGPGKYLRALPVCDEGGSYTLGPMDTPPACNLARAGHRLGKEEEADWEQFRAAGQKRERLRKMGAVVVPVSFLLFGAGLVTLGTLCFASKQGTS